MKAVETRLNNPSPHLFAEAREQVLPPASLLIANPEQPLSSAVLHTQIYQLLKMDCYMRFKRSNIVKECLLADMAGSPLPIGPAPPITKNPWKKQKVIT